MSGDVVFRPWHTESRAQARRLRQEKAIEAKLNAPKCHTWLNEVRQSIAKKQAKLNKETK